jgi:hypothetical protein
LLGALIISALTFNVNLLSNAMVQGNNGYDSYSNSKIYYDVNTYSKYPTKDKKIACQTGHFEGFFVNSVEFCKLKIAQGPEGPAGPQGIPGITQLNATNIYRVVGPTDTHIGDIVDFVDSIAECNARDILLNGFTAAGRDHVVAAAEPTESITTLLPTGYLASLFGKEVQVTSVAYCFDNPP